MFLQKLISSWNLFSSLSSFASFLWNTSLRTPYFPASSYLTTSIDLFIPFKLIFVKTFLIIRIFPSRLFINGVKWVTDATKMGKDHLFERIALSLGQ